MARIFISYKRNVVPDTPVATKVFEALSGEHSVFIDQTLKVGEDWAKKIQEEIEKSDYLICFLSEYSVHSEMVIAEISTAYHHGKANGKPTILPVRLNFNEAFQYPLSAYLDPLQWAVWRSDADTDDLIKELSVAVRGTALPEKAIDLVTPEEEVPTAFANVNLESPEGTMPHDSQFYIERNADKIALDAINRLGVTITIKAPRQMGKSSLLARVMHKAIHQGQHVAFLDFQMIEKDVIDNPESFYRMFCSWVTFELGCEDETEKYWKLPLGQIQRTTNYFQKHILKSLDGPLLLAMDEVERMFDAPFRSDFFSMLRSWHNNRATKPAWKNYTQTLVTSTEPYQFIADLNQSPFNVGEVVELQDFSIEALRRLNFQHNSILNEYDLDEFYRLLAGHPYLSRKGLYLLANRRIDFKELLDDACSDQGPFGDHLRNHLFRMHNQSDLKDAFLQVILSEKCEDENLFFRLRGAGLVKRMDHRVVPRNDLYADYFKRRLHG